MPWMQTGALIESELEADLDRFAAWLRNAEDTTRRRRRKARREQTTRLYRERMGHLLRRAQRITPDVDTLRAAFVGWMGEPTRYGRPPSDSTVRSSYYALKAWCQWKNLDLGASALEDFDIPPNPDNARGDDVVLSQGTARLLLSRLAEMGDRRNYAICRTILRGGPRRKVIALAKRKHFFHAERRIHIPDENGKGGHGGNVIVDQHTADAIMDYLRSRPDRGDDPEAPLFHSYLTGGHLHPDSVTDLIGDLTAACLGEPERRTPHDLRHHFITVAANGIEGEPMPIPQLQRQVQHSRPATTLRYVHPAGDAREAYDRSMGNG